MWLLCPRSALFYYLLEAAYTKIQVFQPKSSSLDLENPVEKSLTLILEIDTSAQKVTMLSTAPRRALAP